MWPRCEPHQTAKNPRQCGSEYAGEYAVFSMICFLVMLSVVTCGIVRLKVSPIRLAIKMCGH